MWEDEGNKYGGKISIKLRKDFTTIIWEELILAFIADILPKNLKEEINGIVVSVKKDYNILQIWFRNYQKNKISYLEKTFRRIFQVPNEVRLEKRRFFNKDFNSSSKRKYSPKN